MAVLSWKTGRRSLLSWIVAHAGRPHTSTHNLSLSLVKLVRLYPKITARSNQVKDGGKSTLIKLLIDHQESRQDSSAPSTYPFPVAGASVNDTVPTSADVHLYVDPESYTGDKPMLYADCEGLDAGEEPPMGSWSRRNKGSDRNRLVRKFANGRVHALEWATTDQKRTRQFAVTELYPRLLYTFSDVVVFVLRNAKYDSIEACGKLSLTWRQNFSDCGIAKASRMGLRIPREVHQPAGPSSRNHRCKCH